MDLAQYAELFLAESREHLTAVNDLLLAWEREPASREPVAGVFRAVHTIKGMAATMGYAPVADLAHRMESLLDRLRQADREPTDAQLELLFRAADALEHAVDAAVAGRQVKAERGRAAALDRAARELDPGPSPAARAAEPEEHPVAAAGGRVVRVVLRSDAPLRGPRALLVMQRVQALGQVSAVQPPLAAFESDEFRGEFTFHLAGDPDDEAVERVIRGAGDVDQVTFAAPETGDRRAESGAQARHVRVDLRRLDSLMNLIGELVTARSRLSVVAAQRADPELDEVALRLAQLTAELQTDILQARMTPVWQVFDRFPRLVRDLGRRLGKQVDFAVEGKDLELDRALLDHVADPLVHLLRNAVDHGIETPEARTAAGKPATGRIVLAAARERDTIAIRVTDDGRGIDRNRVLAEAKARGWVDADLPVLTDEQLIRVLARPGFSTAAVVSDVSGRGVGVDVVVTQVRALGGAVELRTEPGRGSRFTLRLPTSLAIVQALITRVGDERYVLPMTHVAETVDFDPRGVTRVEGRDALVLRNRLIPLVHLRQTLDVGGTPPPPSRRPVIVLQIGDRSVGIVVDAMLGQQEVMVKTFDAPSGMLPVFSGATILGDGAPVLILDAASLV